MNRKVVYYRVDTKQVNQEDSCKALVARFKQIMEEDSKKSNRAKTVKRIARQK